MAEHTSGALSGAEEPFPQLPTETEIYILPSGEIVVADLPVELAERLSSYAILKSLDEVAFPPYDADQPNLAAPA